MNVKVTNHKQLLDVMMKKYLDDFLSDNHMFNLDDLIIIREDLGEDAEYDDEVIIEFDGDDGRLFIRHDLFDNFTAWFPIGKERAAHFIKDWFEGVANVHVDYIESNEDDNIWLI